MNFWTQPDPEPEEPFDVREPDAVEAAFEDYQTSIADLIDEFPGGVDEFRTRLEAATATWERDTFALVVKHLRRDVRFRIAMYRASKTRPQT